MHIKEHHLNEIKIVLGSILVAASIHFASVAWVQVASNLCDLGLTIEFMKTVE